MLTFIYGKVVEELSIPFIPKTTFKAKFTRLPRGSKWESWAAMGVNVITSCIINEGEVGQEEELTNCQAIEETIMTCPFYIYPLVKWQMSKSHVENNFKLQRYFDSLKTSSS